MALMVLFVCGLVAATVNAAQIPSPIKVCNRNDPNVAKCIINSVEYAKPFLRKGIEEVDVPALEPLRVRDILVPVDIISPNTTVLFQKIRAYGPTDFEITKLKLDVPNAVYSVGLVFPLLRINGVFTVQLGAVKVNGHFHINATNIICNSVLRAQIEGKEKRQIRFTKLDVDVKVSDYNLKVDRLFSSDETSINELVNNVVNQNRQLYINLFTPVIEERASHMILERANMIARHFDYDEVFPLK